MENHNPFLFTHLLAITLMLVFQILKADPLSQALLSLKSEITDDFNSLDDWSLPSESVPIQPITKIHACSWTGVKCSEDSSKIISLDLSMKNLGGSLSGKQFNLFLDLVELNLSHNSFSEKLPAAIFNLTNLRSLDLSRNNFSVHFPSGISNLNNLVVLDAFSNSFLGPLPPDVSEIDSLEVLNFAGSYFTGPIPSEYGSFKNLVFLQLSGNFLSGFIPPELGKMKTLSHLEIGYNSYEGGIPWQFGNMSELQYLDIADSNLSGPIPVHLSNLTKLESLFLFRNGINGKIPQELSKIFSLKSLDLSDNILSGQIPENFSELKNIRLLSLMYNDLTGSVPKGIAKLPELDTLLIWSNYFTGSLPEDLGRYSKLRHVDVSTNSFLGSIPPGICSGRELQRLILFSNNFTGGLSPSLSNCSSLLRLRLEDNSFAGTISLQFGKLPDISYIDLSRNRFVGGIPSDIVQASALQYFNVSDNKDLGGTIPIKMWSLPNLENFSVNSCGISGSIPQFDSCKSFSVVELRMNSLSGEIPLTMSNCQGLVRIDLAENNLTGLVPLEIARLHAVSVLDLSHNRFIGPIPSEFGNSSSLKLLNLSYNDFSGSIPPLKNLKMMDPSAFYGNPKLCGEPLRSCHHEKGIPIGLERGSRRAQKLAWVLIICAIVVLFIVSAIFGLLHFKKGSEGQWKMVIFTGFPQFTAKDVLRCLNSIEARETGVSNLPDSIGNFVLPTGITVSVKKIEWEPNSRKILLQLLTRIGNARHKNLTRLLGICYNNHLAYLLYDYLPNGNLAEKIRERRDWETKSRIVTGIAKALCFLHQDCYLPHGNLKACNILFDENMEPHLSGYGLGSIFQSANTTLAAKTGGIFIISVRNEISMDVYNFGEIVLELLTNGRSKNSTTYVHSTPSEVLIREIADENRIVPSNLSYHGMKSIVELALSCIRSRPSDRPSMQDALKLLSVLKPQSNDGNGIRKEYGHKL